MTSHLKHSLFAKATATAAALALVPTIAIAGLSIGEKAGMTEADLRAYFEKQGYTVEEIETEDGETEVEVTLNDKEFEVTVETATGRITGIEEDDD